MGNQCTFLQEIKLIFALEWYFWTTGKRSYPEQLTLPWILLKLTCFTHFAACVPYATNHELASGAYGAPCLTNAAEHVVVAI